MEILRIENHDQAKMESAFLIRKKVFQEEQHVSPSIDFDGQDENSKHWLALEQGRPVGTVRVRILEGKAKIERMAVLKEFRNQWTGRALMEAILKELHIEEIRQVYLYSQTSARRFYEKLGFQVQGNEFYQAGIPHVEMSLTLPE